MNKYNNNIPSEINILTKMTSKIFTLFNINIFNVFLFNSSIKKNITPKTKSHKYLSFINLVNKLILSKKITIKASNIDNLKINLYP